MFRSRFAAAAIVILLIPSGAFATHDEPKKANKVQSELVNGFFECTSPNTTMQSNGALACTPPTANGSCAFTSNGAGKLTFAKIGSAGTQDLKIQAVASGLSENCENHTLHVRLLYRLTNDDCPEGSCTATDNSADLTGASCTVTNGKCKINTTLNTAAPGSVPNGKNSDIEVLGCGLKDFIFLPGDPELRCGVLLK